MPKQERRIMRRFKISEISAVDEPAQRGALMTLTKSKKSSKLTRRVTTKRIGSKQFYASDFAYVGDRIDPSTWQFLLTNAPGGAPTKKAVNNVLKQIQRYNIPDDALESVLDKLREAWAKAFPDKLESEMPMPIGESDEEIAARAAAAGVDEIDPNVGIGDDPDTIPEDEEDSAITNAEEPELDEEGNPIEEEVDPTEDAVDPAADPNANAGSTDPAEEDEEDDEENKPKKKPQPRLTTTGSTPAAKAASTVDAIIKRYIDPMEGALSFPEVIECYEDDRRYSQVMEVAWPLVSALDTSLRSIIADKNVDVAAKHTMMRGSVEGFLAAIREEWPEVQEALDEALEVDSGDEQGDDVMLRKKLVEKSSTNDGLDEIKKSVADLQAKLKKSDEEKAAAIARAEQAEAVAKMSDTERKHFNLLKSDEQKGDFIKMDSKARRAAIEKAASDDETVVVEGETIRKSDVGAQSFKILKAQADRMARLEKQAEEEHEARMDAEYRKQADEEMAHLPGDPALKARVLRAIDQNIEDTEVRECLAKMLSSGDKAVQSAFHSIGSRGGSDEPVQKGGVHPFLKAINAIKARDKCSHQEAMQRARAENPEDFEDYQGLE